MNQNIQTSNHIAKSFHSISEMAVGVIRVVAALLLAVLADPIFYCRANPTSQSGRVRDYSHPQHTVARFIRPSTENGPGLALALPNSYPDLGPNVRASKSYKRPMRRMGLAYESEENEDLNKGSNNIDDSNFTLTSGLGVTSQPDISSVISTSQDKEMTKFTDRVNQLKKKFPKFRSRNNFGARTTVNDSPDDSHQRLTDDTTENPLDKFTGRSSDSSSGIESRSTVVDTPTTENQRPFQVRRPNNRLSLQRSTRRPLRTRFQQILNNKNPNEDSQEAVSFVEHLPSTPEPSASNSHSTSPEYISPDDASVPLKSLGGDVKEHWNTASSRQADASENFQDENINKFAGPTAFSSTKRYINRHSSHHTQLPTFDDNKQSGVEMNENSKQNHRLDQNQKELSEDFRNDNQYQPEPISQRQNDDNEYIQENTHHNYGSPMKPSTFDDGKDWYPNNPNDSDKKDPIDINYGQFRNNFNDAHEETNSDITNSQENQVNFSPNPQHNRQRFISRRPLAPLVTSDNHPRSDELPSNQYDIPDLSINSQYSPEKETTDQLQHIFNHEPVQEISHIRNPHYQPPIGYQDFSRTPVVNEGGTRKNLFDQNFVNGNENFNNVPTTERTLMEPTKVPGSPHLVTRNEFPYNFWQPANMNVENMGIYPKKRQHNQDEGHNFRHVPDHLFSVGAGPVSLPEELVKNTYEMVTSEPTFDLMSNPFESGEKKFNSLPDVNEIGPSVGLNRRRIPPRGQRNRRPTAPRQGPFQGIMNFINPRPSHAPNLVRPNNVQVNHLETTKLAPDFPVSQHPNRITEEKQHETVLQINPQIPVNFNPHIMKPEFNQHNGAIGYIHFDKEREKSNVEHPANRHAIEGIQGIRGHSENRQFTDGNQMIGNEDRTNIDKFGNRLVGDIQNNQAIHVNANVDNHPHHFGPNNFQSRPTPTQNGQRNFRNRIRPNLVGPNQHNRNRRPNNAGEFIIKEPTWVSGFDKSIVKPVNPHSRFVTTQSSEHGTKSHFDVKYYYANQTEEPEDAYDLRSGSQRHEQVQRPSQPFQFELNQKQKQSLQSFNPPNRHNPKQNYERQRVRRPHQRPITHLNNVPNVRSQKLDTRQKQQPQSSQSIWSLITDFDFSFLNPFNQDSDSEVEDVDRVASGAALTSSLLVPGGIAILGAGLGLFYFNYGWLVQTPVVKARLVDLVMKGTHTSFLTEEQQRAIGDVTKASLGNIKICP